MSGAWRAGGGAVDTWPGVLLRTLAETLRLARREYVIAERAHEIRVVVRGLLPAVLLIDGCEVDRRSPLLASRERHIPLLSARLTGGRIEPSIVEIYARGRFAREFEARIRGKRRTLSQVL